MMMSFRSSALALLLGTALPLHAAAAVPVEAARDTPESVIAAPRLDLAAVGRLYDRALSAGTVEALHDRLDALAAAAGQPERRARVALVKAALYWREGDRTDAVAAADAAIAASPSADAYALRGELAEILDAAAAADLYRKARALATDPAERARLDLRVALIDALPKPDTLIAFAGTRPAAGRGDLATVLALLDRPAAALTLDGTGGGAGAAGLADALRIAERAAAAGDAVATRKAAWRAYALATDIRDRRYALALVVEGWRIGHDIAGAQADLAARPQTPDVEEALIDVVLEAGRLPEAVALVRRSRDPALRGRLIGILELAGDPAATIAEFRRLIAAAPHDLSNYVGLAATYLGRGDTDRARAVFRDFFTANRGRADLLVAAGRQMIAMGLSDEAAALMRADGSAAAADVTRLFLFRSDLDQGRDADARGELARLAAANPSAAMLGEIADGYDRLHEPAKALDMLLRLERSGPLDYDRQTQAADLAARTGRTDEALRRWLVVWDEATLPARRGYAEKQIAELGRKANRIDALARASEARLAAGTARADEIDLLISLRLAGDDRAGALAAVQRYAATLRRGAGEIDALRRLAQIYARLKDYPALQTTLRRLAAIDPANRDDYLRQLTLTLVRYGGSDGTAVQRAQIDAVLDGFRDAAPDFRGAVYAAAGMGAAALDQYRAALAADPGSGDALTRYADALKKQGGGSEAATLLQFQVESSTDAGAVAAALDGVLDLVDPGNRRSAIGPARLAALRWVERRALERIAQSGMDSRMAGILVDVADMLGDIGLEVRTYDESLATAGGQRPYVLRQLVNLTAPAGTGGQARTLEDPERRLRYAHRLLALHQSYPPEFYGDIATALLKQGDRAGAERAFAMMGDGGALVNVDEVRGRAYAAAGLTEPALSAMGLALARDQDNLDLLVDTSILREQNGKSALAFAWYWQGLARLVGREAEGARNDSDQRFDTGKFMPTLIEGSLLNWPADAAGRTKVAADLQRMFDAALAPVDRTVPARLIDHARLASIVDIGHRVRAAGLGGGVPARWDATLDPLFAGDIVYRHDIAFFRALQGETVAGVPAWTDRAAASLFVQARDSGNAELALALAIGANDMAMARAVIEDDVELDQAWREASAKKQNIGGMPPDVPRLLGEAVDRLSPDQVRAVVTPAVEAAKNGERALFDLYRGQPDAYRRLADAMGRPPIAQARLLDLLNTSANIPIAWSASTGVYWGGDWTPGTFTTEQQLDLYDRLTARMQNGDPASPLATGVLRALLARPLDPTQSARLAAILQRDVAFVRDPRQRSVVTVLPHLLMPDTAPANRPLLMAAAAQATRTYPDAAELVPFLTAWFAGRQPEAMHRLDALEAGLRSQPRLEKAIDWFRGRVLAAARKRTVDAVMGAAKPAPEAVTAFYRDVVVGAADSLSGRQMIDYARRLVALDPDNRAYLALLIKGYRQRGELDLLAGTLRPYVDRHPEDVRTAAALALTYRLLGRRVEAEAVAGRSGAKLDDPHWVAGQVAADRAGGDAPFTGFLSGMYDRYGYDYPDDRMVQEVARLRAGGGESPSRLKVLIDDVLAAQRAAPASVPGVLRGWWRTGISDAWSRDSAIRVLARRIGDGTAPALAPIFARPDVIAELSHYLVALSAEDRHAAQPLYDLVSYAIVAGGRAPARLAELGEQLRSGAIDADGFQHFVTLADIAQVPLDPATMTPLAAQLRRSPAMAVGERVRLAAVFARSGQPAAAIDLLTAALDQTAYPFTPLDRGGSAGTIVASLARWSDRDSARRAYDALVRRAKAITGADPTNTLELPPFDAAGLKLQ